VVISDWLRRLGLEQYKPVFRENKIDKAILPRPHERGSEGLGLVAVGDPRRLLNAIAGLGSAAASSRRGFSVGESG
jgi:hypothetical protein